MAIASKRAATASCPAALSASCSLKDTRKAKKIMKKLFYTSVLLVLAVYQTGNICTSILTSLSSNSASSTSSSFFSSSAFSFLTYANANLNFVSIGNWGYDTETRQNVADTLKGVMRKEGITFIVSPGSNFGGGISALNDTKWVDLYEKTFSDDLEKSFKVPFFTVLGAEDWTGNYTAEILRTTVDYDPESRREDTSFPKWTMPNWWYHYVTSFAASSGPSLVKTGHKDMGVAFAFIDTWVLSDSFPYSNVTKKAWDDLETILSNAAKMMDYIIVVGDKAIHSSGGSKGDASLGYYLEPMLRKYNVDAYISGNDFSLEIIQKGNVSHINCGSAAMTSGFEIRKSSDSLYYTGNPGFCLHKLTADGMYTKLIEAPSGEEIFSKKHEPQERTEKTEFSPMTEPAGAGESQLPEVKYFPVPLMERTMGSRDTFVKVIGTIGLAILTIFLLLAVSILASKATKN